MTDTNHNQLHSESAHPMLDTFEIPTPEIVDGPVIGEALVASGLADAHASAETHNTLSTLVYSSDVAECDPPKTLSEDLPETPSATQVDVTESKKARNDRDNDAVTTFADLPLSEQVQKAVQKAGYVEPTEIQAQIIPHVLAGRDVLAQSQTGTGKTAAFALPILSRINVASQKPQVLVLAPTRELAMQVADSFMKYGEHLSRFNVAAIYGGQGYETQLRQLRRGVPVVVGTPGRVIDHIKRGTLDLSEIDCLVLDEADEMLNMGFLDDVQFVLEQTPEDRQIALFSATLPAPIRVIADNYLNDPVRITIQRRTMTAEAIRQRAVFVAPRDKIDVLARFLEVEDTNGVIVFTRTREATVSVAENLSAQGISAVALNGDMPQSIRERTIDQLKSGRLDVLVATDVAARGLDVSRISHVFNFDAPQDIESYVHRIGRTGRAGRNGEAIIFLTNSQRHRLKAIERATHQSIEVVERPTADQINAIRIERFKQQITDTVASKDLSVFHQIIAQYASETDVPMPAIAAALAEMCQQGRAFITEDVPRRQRRDRQERNSEDRKDGRDRRRQRGEASDRPRREGRRSGPPEAGMDRYRIAIGHQDGVKPGNIVGAVANEGGISGQDIGPIRIYDTYSTIDLPQGMPRDVYEVLQDVRVAGKHLRLRPATEDESQGPSGSGRPSRGFKPRGNRRSDRKGKPSGKSFGSRKPKRVRPKR